MSTHFIINQYNAINCILLLKTVHKTICVIMAFVHSHHIISYRLIIIVILIIYVYKKNIRDFLRSQDNRQFYAPLSLV